MILSYGSQDLITHGTVSSIQTGPVFLSTLTTAAISGWCHPWASCTSAVMEKPHSARVILSMTISRWLAVTEPGPQPFPQILLVLMASGSRAIPILRHLSGLIQWKLETRSLSLSRLREHMDWSTARIVCSRTILSCTMAPIAWYSLRPSLCSSIQPPHGRELPIT